MRGCVPKLTAQLSMIHYIRCIWRGITTSTLRLDCIILMSIMVKVHCIIINNSNITVLKMMMISISMYPIIITMLRIQLWQWWTIMDMLPLASIFLWQFYEIEASCCSTFPNQPKLFKMCCEKLFQKYYYNSNTFASLSIHYSFNWIFEHMNTMLIHSFFLVKNTRK